MLKNIVTKLGIDKAIAYTILSRVFQGFSGVVSVLLISTFLTNVEQGFYYTFSSILAIQIFFELGLTSIISQFVAHEKSHLTEVDSTLVGEEIYKSRLSHLFRFCLKWYGFVSIILFVGIVISGILFFSYFYQSTESVNWQMPWIILVLGTSLNFIISPISAFIEGLGMVKEIAKIRLIQQLFILPVFWILLIFKFNLFAAVFGPFLGVLVFVAMAKPMCGKLLLSIYRMKITDKISYLHEIFPYQWRIALSWISGYFIFQLFNPVIFAFDGPISAGQMGMTLSVINSINALAFSWISTKIPALSSLIALKQYSKLDEIFKRTVRQQLFIAISAVLLMFLAVFIVHYLEIKFNDINIGDRLLPYFPMLMMSVAMIANQYIGAIATYLRCHKQEPFMILSIVNGVLCMLSTILLGKYFGVYGVTIGYCIITLTILPWGYYIFKANKKKWHNQY